MLSSESPSQCLVLALQFRSLAFSSIGHYGGWRVKFRSASCGRQLGRIRLAAGNVMRRLLLIVGLFALAIGLLWIGQGTGAIAWPKESFMINQIQWAGYGAALAAVGLILIWQSQR